MHRPTDRRTSALLRSALAAAAIGLLFTTAVAFAEQAGDGKVLARVDGTEVTQAEIAKNLAGQMLQLERQRHEMIETGVRARVQELLIQQAAAKQGLSQEDFLKAEVEGKTAQISTEAVTAFYTPRAAQIRQPLEQVEGQIRQYLAYQTLIQRLEAEAEIAYFTEPFRIDVPAEGPAKGPADAPVTIVEFGDFECPPCGRSYATIKEVREKYGDKVQVVFRQYPLDAIHPHARKAAEASLCAADQGKFWELHDQMFENQQKLAVEDLKQAASEIDGLDAAAFTTCLDQGKHAEAVEVDVAAGNQIGVSGTPTFFVNGRLLPGLPSIEDFSRVIDEELARGSS